MFKTVVQMITDEYSKDGTSFPRLIFAYQVFGEWSQQLRLDQV